MKASDWEFRNRAMIFGMMFGLCFPLYAFDNLNSATTVADWLGLRTHRNPDSIVRAVFAAAAALLVLAAFIRTWASSYLQANVVYASQVKSALLVADGPYRYVRNPLYLANVLMAIAMGAMMSRLGFIVEVTLMFIFCYRLILREESDLLASQGESYQRYLKAVPRLAPSPWPRTLAAGVPANWRAGLAAESWYWGFAASLVAFAVTLKLWLFFTILAASIAFLSIRSSRQQKSAAG